MSDPFMLFPLDMMLTRRRMCDSLFSLNRGTLSSRLVTSLLTIHTRDGCCAPLCCGCVPVRFTSFVCWLVVTSGCAPGVGSLCVACLWGDLVCCLYRRGDPVCLGGPRCVTLSC